MKTFAVAAVIVTGVLGACSLADEDDASTTSVALAPSTTVLTTTSSSRGGTASTTASQRVTAPEDAASKLFNAWRAGDRVSARRFADDAAVTELFRHTPSDPPPTFDRCTLAPPYECGYRYQGGTIVFRISGDASAGYRVAAVQFVAD